jgi:hypothetical protein
VASSTPVLMRYGPILGLGARGSFGSEVDAARRLGAK